MKFSYSVFCSAVLICWGFAPSTIWAQSPVEPAPWETVEVIPKPPKRSLSRSPDVTVQVSRIEKVTIYTESFCRDCKKVIEFLTAREIPHQALDIYLTLTGLPNIVLSGERPPITVVEYTDGTKRKIIGYDEAILTATFEPASGSASSNDFELSDFDLRGTIKDKEKDSFDLR